VEDVSTEDLLRDVLEEEQARALEETPRTQVEHADDSWAEKCSDERLTKQMSHTLVLASIATATLFRKAKRPND
jgi:hypothetical protein